MNKHIEMPPPIIIFSKAKAQYGKLRKAAPLYVCVCIVTHFSFLLIAWAETLERYCVVVLLLWL